MKIVVAALVASIGLATFAIAARINVDDGFAQTFHIFKTKAHIQDRKFATALPTPPDCFIRRCAPSFDSKFLPMQHYFA